MYVVDSYLAISCRQRVNISICWPSTVVLENGAKADFAYFFSGIWSILGGTSLPYLNIAALLLCFWKTGLKLT
jgi:hypothetical protein